MSPIAARWRVGVRGTRPRKLGATWMSFSQERGPAGPGVGGGPPCRVGPWSSEGRVRRRLVLLQNRRCALHPAPGTRGGLCEQLLLGCVLWGPHQDLLSQ